MQQVGIDFHASQRGVDCHLVCAYNCRPAANKLIPLLHRSHTLLHLPPQGCCAVLPPTRVAVVAMPCVFVPEDDLPSSNSVSHAHSHSSRGHVRIEYKQVGNGPIIVALVPGLCCPSSMFDQVADALEKDKRYTAILIENRGMMGSGHANTGWRVSRLAADAWAVVDAVRKRRDSDVVTGVDGDRDENTDAVSGDPDEEAQPLTSTATNARVALVGHSMGGMIVQRMAAQRPHDVGLLVPISTHAGGVWNLIPTLGLIRAFARYAVSGMNRPRAKAAFAMGLHFTQRFLRKHKLELMRRYLDGTTDDYTIRPGDPDTAADIALRGHWAVVRSHSLSRSDATMLARCHKIYKLVITGKADYVIVPSATRKLARALEAHVVLEVEAAHFVVEEASTVVLAGLRIALNEAFGDAETQTRTKESPNSNIVDKNTTTTTANANTIIGATRQDCDCPVCIPGNASIFENLRMC